jgi:hypothetical protein
MSKRGTTFVGDDRYPEFWPCSIEHDLIYEQKLGGPRLEQAFVEECQKAAETFDLTEESGKLARRRFERGYRAYAYGAYPFYGMPSKRLGDKILSAYMWRVVVATPNTERQRQLRMARRQRMFFVNMPAPLKNAFLALNRLFGGK